MNRFDLATTFRMAERVIIVLGGILSIYLGYRLFTLGISTTQGEARVFGIVLRDFGPGLFFAVLGAYVLVQALRAAILSGTNRPAESQESGKPPVDSEATFFYGVEDPTRQFNKWSAKSFFLETRDLLRQIDSSNDPASVETLTSGLKAKLVSITMTTEEYERYQLLTNKADQSYEEQVEFLELEAKLFP